MQRYTGLRYMAVLGTLAILGTACGSTSTSSSQLAANQTLTFPSDSEIGTLDPAQDSAETDSEIAQNLFDGLLKFDDRMGIVPDIATALPDISADGKTYTFHLRHDVTFSNSDPVTANDFIYSWSRAAAEGQSAYGSDFDHVVGYDSVSTASNWPKNPTMMSGLTAPDPYTLVVNLTAPWSVFTTEVAFVDAAPVVDKKVVQTDDANWWATPATEVGTGPYHMVARVPKQSVDFEAVPNWWGTPKPTVKHVHIDFIGDMASGVVSFDQGKYDLIGYGGMGSDIPADDILRIKADPVKSKDLRFVNKVRTIWVSFNFTNPASPFRGLTGPGHDLREALSLAIDRKQMVDIACAHGITCSVADGGLITKGLKGYLGDGTDPLAKFDPVKAKQLLQSADPDGSKTRNLTYVYDPNKAIYKATAENLQAQWLANLNIHVNLQQVEHHTFITNQSPPTHAYILFREGWQADYDHPQDWFDNLFIKSGGSNSEDYSDPKVEDLVARADAEPLSQAIPDYNAASRQMIEDAAYAPLVYFKGQFLFKSYLQGAGSNNFNDFYWNEMSILQH